MEVEAIDVDKIDNPSPVVQSLINLKKKGIQKIMNAPLFKK